MVTTLSARVLGQRIRQMRTRRNLTQQDLAGDDYSKSYISAIEQGKTRPSLEALQRMASRLEMPAGMLLDPDAPGFAPFDPEALPRRVRRRRGVRAGQGPSLNDPVYLDLKISEAEQLIYSGSPGQALVILRPLLPDENGDSRTTRPLDAGQLQRCYYLAAIAAVRHDASAEAIGYLNKGSQAAVRQGDREMQEKMRNILGVAFYQADQPLSALEQHKLCQEAVQNGVVTDPNFKLMVYANLANDYWALHDNDHAMATYKTALELLGEVNSIEKQAAIFWDATTKLGDRGVYMQANALAAKALSLYEALDNIRLVTLMENKYGDILLDMGDFQAAEGYLVRNLELADSLNSEVEKATVLTNLARVSLKRNNTAEATERVEQAIALAREAVKAGKGENSDGQGEKSHAQRRVRANMALARALALAGEVATRGKDPKKADTYFNEAIKIIEAGDGGERGQSGQSGEESSDIYQRYAHVLASRGQHEQASNYYAKAYDIATRHRFLRTDPAAI
jgi:transcriptional regulator with XRE-family HTH domain/Tfp pilus assembly protein PilF